MIMKESRGSSTGGCTDRFANTETRLRTFTSVAFIGDLKTRQLPMGTGHCLLGGYIDQIVCNIHREVHLASHYLDAFCFFVVS